MYKHNTTRSRLLGAAATSLLMMLELTSVAPVAAQSAPLEDLAQFPRASLEITSGKRIAHFTIWIADTPQREEQGLMFVRELPAGQGMLFPQTEPRAMSMWMKNTYVPLDMVFVGANGHISKIVEHAVPQSLATIDSGGVISAVLEIAGGEAAKLGLAVGDAVVWKKT